MEDRRLELHLRWHEGVLWWEGELGTEEATTIESAFVVDHEHDFPFEDIRICDPARYARYVLIGLHLPELAT